MTAGMDIAKADTSGMSQLTQTVDVDQLMTQAQSEIVSGNYAKAEAILNGVETGLNNAVISNSSLDTTSAVQALRNVVAEVKGMTIIMPAMAAKANIENTVNSAMTIGMNIARSDASGMSQLTQTVDIDGLMNEAKTQIFTGNYAGSRSDS